MRFVLALTLAVTSLAAISPDRPPERPRTAAKPVRVPESRRIGPEAVQATDTAAFVAYTDGVAVAQYLDALAVTAYLDALEAARLAAETRARVPAPTYHAPTTVSGDCAPVAAIVGWGIVNRESGGNPSAANPSGAYGCSQTLLSHYNGGVCSGLDPYTVAGQAACTQILYDRGGLAPWSG